MLRISTIPEPVISSSHDDDAYTWMDECMDNGRQNMDENAKNKQNAQACKCESYALVYIYDTT